MANERKTPQEKKRQSLTKDRRNTYGENDKASRKNIPRSKARAHRAVRRKAAEFERTWELLDENSANAVELTMITARTQKAKFRKGPDTALGRVLAAQRARRQRHNSNSTD